LEFAKIFQSRDFSTSVLSPRLADKLALLTIVKNKEAAMNLRYLRLTITWHNKTNGNVPISLSMYLINHAFAFWRHKLF